MNSQQECSDLHRIQLDVQSVVLPGMFSKIVACSVIILGPRLRVPVEASHAVQADVTCNIFEDENKSL